MLRTHRKAHTITQGVHLRLRASLRLAVVATGCSLGLAGCRGNLVARADLHRPGTTDVQFASTGAPLVLWADTDGKWTGPGGRHAHFPAHYEVDVLAKHGKPTHVTCDTRNASQEVCGTETTIGSTHDGDCEIKLDCALPTLPAGEASLHIVATVGREVSEIRDLSINLRQP